MKKQQGFTLIELMIVVAIVGILAAIAIPAYKDYLVRSKVSECAAALSACKTSVTEFYFSKSAWPSLASSGCTNVASQHCGAVTTTGPAITNSVLASTGVGTACTLTLTAQLGGTGNTDIIGWDGSTGCLAKYVPAEFR